MTAPIPLPLRRITSKQARLLRDVGGRTRPIAFELGQRKCTLRLGVSAGEFRPTFWLRVTLGDAALWLGLAQAPQLGDFADGMEELDLKTLPPLHRRLVLETAWEPWLNQLEKALRASLSILDAGAQGPPPGEGEIVPFVVDRDREPAWLAGYLQADFPVLEAISSALASVPPTPLRTWDAVPFEGRIILGVTELSLADFRELHRQDVVLLDRYFSLEEGRGWVSIAGVLHFRAQLNGDGAVTLSDSMSAPLPPGAAAAPTTARPGAIAESTLDDLPVQIVFEAGRRDVTLAEIRSLQPGYVFELENPAARPVIVRANGKAIGTGELLQIGDRVGVRITELYPT